MSTTTTAGTAREGMTMDESETTRLRALLEGAELPWAAMKDFGDEFVGDDRLRMVVLCPHVDTDDRDTVATIDMGHGEECDEAHAALIVAAVNALPGLLDAAERAERAEARVRELEAIIAGRTTPPTSTERVAHLRATGYDGRWRVRHGALDLVGVFHDSVLLANALRVTDARWWPLDAEGRPCAWPTAEVFR